MTDERDLYDRHLEAFGASLRRTSTTYPVRRARRARMLAVGGAMTVASAVAATILVIVPGGTPVDVVGQARAALAEQADVLHYTVRESRGPVVGTGLDIRAGRQRCNVDGPVRVWRAKDPVRWRVVLPGFAASAACGEGLGVHGMTREIAYADRSVSTYVRETNRLDVVRDYPSDTFGSRIPVGAAVGIGQRSTGEEPLAEVQRMLRDGKLEDRGERKLDGRLVRTFSGRTSTSMRIDGRTYRFQEQTVYDVDASRLVPVRMVRTSVMPRISRAPGSGELRASMSRVYANQLDFESYERLPLDEAGRKLLRITPKSRPTTTSITYLELRKKARAGVPRGR